MQVTAAFAPLSMFEYLSKVQGNLLMFFCCMHSSMNNLMYLNNLFYSVLEIQFELNHELILKNDESEFNRFIFEKGESEFLIDSKFPK